MKHVTTKILIACVVLVSSLVIAEKLYNRSLRNEWTKSKMITIMTPAQTMNITGAKAAYRNSIGYIGNKKNTLAFGISFVANKDPAVTNSLGLSYSGQPKDLAEFANASGSLMSYMAAACLGSNEQTSRDFGKFFFETIGQAEKAGKPITVQRQFGVFNMYIGNASVKEPTITYSIVISTSGVLGKAGWVEYCNPKQ